MRLPALWQVLHPMGLAQGEGAADLPEETPDSRGLFSEGAPVALHSLAIFGQSSAELVDLDGVGMIRELRRSSSQ